ERSIWPAKWPIEFLNKIRHTRSYLKNFANDPMGVEGGYWTLEDFKYEVLPNVTAQFLSIDPTITTKTTSDPAGIAVVSYAPGYTEPPATRSQLPVKVPSRCSVDFAAAVRLVGEQLRTYVLKVLQQHPRIRMIVVEGNQGGENWHAILH